MEKVQSSPSSEAFGFETSNTPEKAEYVPAQRIKGGANRPATLPRTFRPIVFAVGLMLTLPSLPAAADVADFRPYAASLIDQLVIGTENLHAAVDAGDLDAAKAAWIVARTGWEAGETFLGEFFPQHDEAIDLWPDAKAGFHGVEPILFTTGELAPAKPLVDKLRDDVNDLQTAFGKTEITRQGLLNGLAGLTFEVGSEKADGGESPFSDTSLRDMKNNMRGIEATYTLAFAEDLRKADAAAHKQVMQEMIAMEKLLDVSAIAALDQAALLESSERLAILIGNAAAPLGLEKPELGD